MTVFWSTLARNDYWKNIEYLERDWTIKEVQNFIEQVDSVLYQIKNESVTFKSSHYKNVYQVPVVKQITLYYRINGNEIILLRFWNNYQNLDNFSLK